MRDSLCSGTCSFPLSVTPLLMSLALLSLCNSSLGWRQLHYSYTTGKVCCTFTGTFTFTGTGEETGTGAGKGTGTDFIFIKILKNNCNIPIKNTLEEEKLLNTE